MPRIPVRTEPYSCPHRQHRHYKTKRDLILRSLGKSSYINGSQFALVLISARGDIEYYSSELLQNDEERLWDKRVVDELRENVKIVGERRRQEALVNGGGQVDGGGGEEGEEGVVGDNGSDNEDQDNEDGEYNPAPTTTTAKSTSNSKSTSTSTSTTTPTTKKKRGRPANTPAKLVNDNPATNTSAMLRKAKLIKQAKRAEEEAKIKEMERISREEGQGDDGNYHGEGQLSGGGSVEFIPAPTPADAGLGVGMGMGMDDTMVEGDDTLVEGSGEYLPIKAGNSKDFFSNGNGVGNNGMDTAPFLPESTSSNNNNHNHDDYGQHQQQQSQQHPPGTASLAAITPARRRLSNASASLSFRTPGPAGQMLHHHGHGHGHGQPTPLPSHLVERSGAVTITASGGVGGGGGGSHHGGYSSLPGSPDPSMYGYGSPSSHNNNNYGTTNGLLEPKILAIPLGNLYSYYSTRFTAIQQNTCKLIIKTWIKVIEPKKQSRYPYKDGDDNRPDWWPEGVRHREPDHLMKGERVEMLTKLIRAPPLTISRMELATAEMAAHISQPKMRIIREIYKVAKEEERRRMAGTMDESHGNLIVNLNGDPVDIQVDGEFLPEMSSTPMMSGGESHMASAVSSPIMRSSTGRKRKDRDFGGSISSPGTFDPYPSNKENQMVNHHGMMVPRHYHATPSLDNAAEAAESGKIKRVRGNSTASLHGPGGYLAAPMSTPLRQSTTLDMPFSTSPLARHEGDGMMMPMYGHAGQSNGGCMGGSPQQQSNSSMGRPSGSRHVARAPSQLQRMILSPMQVQGEQHQQQQQQQQHYMQEPGQHLLHYPSQQVPSGGGRRDVYIGVNIGSSWSTGQDSPVDGQGQFAGLGMHMVDSQGNGGMVEQQQQQQPHSTRPRSMTSTSSRSMVLPLPSLHLQQSGSRPMSSGTTPGFGYDSHSPYHPQSSMSSPAPQASHYNTSYPATEPRRHAEGSHHQSQPSQSSMVMAPPPQPMMTSAPSPALMAGGMNGPAETGASPPDAFSMTYYDQFKGQTIDPAAEFVFTEESPAVETTDGAEFTWPAPGPA